MEEVGGRELGEGGQEAVGSLHVGRPHQSLQLRDLRLLRGDVIESTSAATALVQVPTDLHRLTHILATVGGHSMF